MYNVFTCGRYGKTTRPEIQPNLAQMFLLEFTKEEIGTGLISSLIILPPVIIMVLLFRKGRAGTKHKSRFDKVVEEAAEKGLINIPEESFKRPPNSNE